MLVLPHLLACAVPVNLIKLFFLECCLSIEKSKIEEIRYLISNDDTEALCD